MKFWRVATTVIRSARMKPAIATPKPISKSHNGGSRPPGTLYSPTQSISANTPPASSSYSTPEPHFTSRNRVAEQSSMALWSVTAPL